MTTYELIYSATATGARACGEPPTAPRGGAFLQSEAGPRFKIHLCWPTTPRTQVCLARVRAIKKSRLARKEQPGRGGTAPKRLATALNGFFHIFRRLVYRWRSLAVGDEPRPPQLPRPGPPRSSPEERSGSRAISRLMDGRRRRLFQVVVKYGVALSAARQIASPSGEDDRHTSADPEDKYF